jgi:hypothetical protein
VQQTHSVQRPWGSTGLGYFRTKVAGRVSEEEGWGGWRWSQGRALFTLRAVGAFG